MAPTSKDEKKAAVDAAAWMLNVASSVGVIMVNKALMATYGFSCATTLTGLHFATKTLMTFTLRWLGYIQPSHLPFPELLKFVLFANFSIVGMNVSIMWNSVGFYQIAKLSMSPVSCLLEVLLDKIRYSRDTKLIRAVVLLAPAQAASLLLLGPFLDNWLTDKRVDNYAYNLTSLVLGHMKTILVLVMGFFLFGRNGVSLQVLLGMIVAVIGMIWYGMSSSKPGNASLP